MYDNGLRSKIFVAVVIMILLSILASAQKCTDETIEKATESGYNGSLYDIFKERLDKIQEELSFKDPALLVRSQLTLLDKNQKRSAYDESFKADNDKALIKINKNLQLNEKKDIKRKANANKEKPSAIKQSIYEDYIKRAHKSADKIKISTAPNTDDKSNEKLKLQRSTDERQLQEDKEIDFMKAQPPFQADVYTEIKENKVHDILKDFVSKKLLENSIKSLTPDKFYLEMSENEIGNLIKEYNNRKLFEGASNFTGKDQKEKELVANEKSDKVVSDILKEFNAKTFLDSITNTSNIIAQKLWNVKEDKEVRDLLNNLKKYDLKNDTDISTSSDSKSKKSNREEKDVKESVKELELEKSLTDSSLKLQRSTNEKKGKIARKEPIKDDVNDGFKYQLDKLHGIDEWWNDFKKRHNIIDDSMYSSNDLSKLNTKNTDDSQLAKSGTITKLKDLNIQLNQLETLNKQKKSTIKRRDAVDRRRLANVHKRSEINGSFPAVLAAGGMASANQLSYIQPGNLLQSVAKEMNTTTLELARKLTSTMSDPKTGVSNDPNFTTHLEKTIANSVNIPKERTPKNSNNCQQKAVEELTLCDAPTSEDECKDVSYILDKVLRKLERMQAEKSKKPDKNINTCSDGSPCDIMGSWNSYIMGVRFELSPPKTAGRVLGEPEKNNKVLHIDVQERVPPRHHSVIDTDWGFMGSAINQYGGPFYMYAQRKTESSGILATFIGFCRTCGGIDTIFGGWTFIFPSKDCQDITTSIEHKRDIFRRNKLDSKRKERFKNLLFEKSKYATKTICKP